MSGYPGGDLRPAPWFGGGSSVPKCLENASRSSSVSFCLRKTRTSCSYQARLIASTSAPVTAARSTPFTSAPTVPVGMTWNAVDMRVLRGLRISVAITLAHVPSPFNVPRNRLGRRKRKLAARIRRLRGVRAPQLVAAFQEPACFLAIAHLAGEVRIDFPRCAVRSAPRLDIAEAPLHETPVDR